MESASLYRESFRPQFHFSPARNLMNDPNGLVYYDGEYHLFFQCNPDGLDWAWQKLHWGHAISTDLVHWREYPLALRPNPVGSILSGSVVVDASNTSGFKAGPNDLLVAIFTSGSEGNTQHQWDAFQQQSIAFSNDTGRTWTHYDGNPVIPNPGLADFRDPKVFWHVLGQKWILVLAAGERVQFYESHNLKVWTQVGEFGVEAGAHGGAWECPDLFPLAVDGGPITRWVLSVSVQRGGKLPRSATQYFVGSFDGRTFINDNPPGLTLWLDHGPDNYAGVTWSNIPPDDGRRIFIGWMNGANGGPTWPWRGAMTVPRELTLRTIGGEFRLTQNPVRELAGLRGLPSEWRDQAVTPDHNLLARLNGKQYEIVAEFQLDNAGATQFGFKLRVGNGQGIVIAYDLGSSTLTLDRGPAGDATFGAKSEPGKPFMDEAVLVDCGETLHMQIFVDWSSVEVFANGGQAAITDCIFPDEDSVGLELYAIGGEVRLNALAFYPLSSATPQAH